MVRIRTVGFESGDTTELDENSSVTVGVSPAYRVRSGVYAARFVGTTEYAGFNGLILSEFFFRVGFSLDVGVLTEKLVVWSKSGTEIGSARRNASGKLEAYIGVGTLVATGTVTVSADELTYYLLEVRVKIDDAVGVIQVKFNGTMDINFTGDTKPGADTTIDTIRIYGGGADEIYIDDLALNDTSGAADNSWCGDGKIIVLRPNAVGTYTQVPNVVGDATHWGAVDDLTSDGDTTYVWGDDADVGKIDTYNLSAPPSLAGFEVTRVIVEIIARTDLAGAIASYVKSGVTENEGAVQNLTIPYAKYNKEYLTDPNTGAVWTESSLGSLEAGFKIKAPV